jgi:hypothetical protein
VHTKNNFKKCNFLLLQLRFLNDADIRMRPSIGREFILTQVMVKSEDNFMEKLKQIHDDVIGKELEMTIIKKVSLESSNKAEVSSFTSSSRLTMEDSLTSS